MDVREQGEHLAMQQAKEAPWRKKKQVVNTTTATNSLLDALAALKVWRMETTLAADAMHNRLDGLSSYVQQQQQQAQSASATVAEDEGSQEAMAVCRVTDQSSEQNSGAQVHVGTVTRLSAQLDAIRTNLMVVLQGRHLIADAAAPQSSPHNLGGIMEGVRPGDVVVLRPGVYRGGLQVTHSGITIVGGGGGTSMCTTTGGGSVGDGGAKPLATPCLAILPCVKQLHVRGCSLGAPSDSSGTALCIAIGCPAATDAPVTPTSSNDHHGVVPSPSIKAVAAHQDELLFEQCCLSSSGGVPVTIQLSPAPRIDASSASRPPLALCIIFRRCRMVATSASPALRLRSASLSSSSGGGVGGGSPGATAAGDDSCASFDPLPDAHFTAVEVLLEDCELSTAGADSIVAIEGAWLARSIRVQATRCRFVGCGTAVDGRVAANPSAALYAVACTVDCSHLRCTGAAAAAATVVASPCAATSKDDAAERQTPPPLFGFDAATSFDGCSVAVVGVHLRNHRRKTTTSQQQQNNNNNSDATIATRKPNPFEAHEQVALERRLLGVGAPLSVPSGGDDAATVQANAASAHRTNLPVIEYIR